MCNRGTTDFNKQTSNGRGVKNKQKKNLKNGPEFLMDANVIKNGRLIRNIGELVPLGHLMALRKALRFQRQNHIL